MIYVISGGNYMERDNTHGFMQEIISCRLLDWIDFMGSSIILIFLINVQLFRLGSQIMEWCNVVLF